MRIKSPFPLSQNPVPTDRCYGVLDDLLLAGAYPGRVHPTEHRQRLAAPWGAGMRAFVNLMEEHQTNIEGKPFVRYDETLSEFSKQYAEPLELRRLSIPDTSITTPERMRRSWMSLTNHLQRIVRFTSIALGDGKNRDRDLLLAVEAWIGFSKNGIRIIDNVRSSRSIARRLAGP